MDEACIVTRILSVSDRLGVRMNVAKLMMLSLLLFSMVACDRRKDTASLNQNTQQSSNLLSPSDDELLADYVKHSALDIYPTSMMVLDENDIYPNVSKVYDRRPFAATAGFIFLVRESNPQDRLRLLNAILSVTEKCRYTDALFPERSVISDFPSNQPTNINVNSQQLHQDMCAGAHALFAVFDRENEKKRMVDFYMKHYRDDLEWLLSYYRENKAPERTKGFPDSLEHASTDQIFSVITRYSRPTLTHRLIPYLHAVGDRLVADCKSYVTEKECKETYRMWFVSP